MKEEKESSPSSLFHYTTLNSLKCILPSDTKDDINGELFMDFRFSHPMQCNDPMEIKLFTDSLYTGSDESNQLMEKVENKGKEIGEPFIFSLIRHKRKIMSNCPQTEIPMWNMYGNNDEGVRLRLDYKTLKTHCKKNGVLLFPCEYLNNERMRQETQIIREKFHNRNYADDMEYENVYKQYVKYKTLNWNYEYEFRMALWTNNYQIENDKKYCHFKVPLSCLKAIQISPFANYDKRKEEVVNLIKTTNDLGYKEQINVEQSKILIRH